MTSPKAIAAALTALLILSAGCALQRPVREMASPTPDPWHGQVDYVSDPDRAAAKIEELAKKTGGDSGKLTADQRFWLDSVTAGHAREYLAFVAREQAEKARARPDAKTKKKI